MTNTTMPAESLGALPSTVSFYRWEVADKPIAVNLGLDLIERLERDVIESFKAVTKRGSEIGGVLGGRVISGSPRTVTIEHFEPVECDYSRTNLFLLSDPDKIRLSEAVERVRKMGGGLSVTGFFRSNARRDLALDEEDLALATEYFSDPSNVVLLVRPYAMKPSLGGFFIWEQGKIQSESSYLQFPFKRSELEKTHAQFLVGASQSAAKEPLVMPKREEAKPVVVTAPAKREEAGPEPAAFKREEPKPTVMRREEPKAAPAAPPKREEPAPPVFKREERPAAPAAKRDDAAPPKRDERPQIPVSLKREERPAIVPVAPKRDERLSGPTLVTKREEVPAAKKEEKPPAPPAVAKRDERPAVTVRREEKPAVTPATTKREEPAPAVPAEKPITVTVKTEAAPPVVEKKKEEAAAVKAEAAAPVAVPAAVPEFGQSAEEAGPGLFSRMKWVIVGVVLVIALVGGYFGYQAMKSPSGEAAKPADSSLALKVERNAGQLLLTWNRASTLIATATRATLSITDGDHKEDVDLDLGQLRSGSVFYSPMTNDVSFRLEISDVKHGKSLAESVRVLAGRPSPALAAMPSSTTKAVSEAPEKQAPVNSAPSALQAQQAPAAPEQPKVTAGPAVTAAPPKPTSLAARLRAPEPQDLPAPPALESSANELAGSAPTSSATAAAPPPVAPPPAAAQPAKPAVQTAAQPAQTPVQQPAPAAPAQVMPTGGKATEARLVKRVSPSYPALARQTRVSGIVRVRAVVGKDGKVKKTSAISGPPMLRQSASEAVRLWIYAPAMLNGEPVESETQVDVSFMM